MNDKERQLEQLSAYLDGELAAAEAQEVETLLAKDEDLRAELESLRQTRELLRLVPVEPAPKHFAHEVMARAERHHHLGAEAPGGPWRLTRWVTLATAAVVLISAGLALMIIANLPEQTLPGPLGEADGPAAREAEEGGRADGSDIVVAGARPADGETTAEVITEAIWTDDLTRTQREVEEVLVAEGLEAEEPLEARRRASRGIVRAQVFNVQRVKPTQVQLEVDVSVDRIEELKTALTRLRQQQRVVQGPVIFATGEETGDIVGGAKLRDVATSNEDELTEAEEPTATEIAAAPSKPSVPPQDVEM
ncbi:MAG: anti-sigma factor family protein, partial [Planctomycetota bacterium]